MATIQWYPGHMAKAKREAIEKLKLVDVVIELVDARIPESSRNPIVNEIKGQKKQLMLLNKTDLADPIQTKKWMKYYQEEGIEVLTVEAKDGKGNQAETANRPGVTKGQRWLKIGNDFELLDTPGILWPKFDNQEIGNKLAVTGAIKDSLLHMDDVALFAINIFRTYYTESLRKPYGLSDADLELSDVDLLLLITKKLGFKDDYERASERIIFDIRGGKLGRYTLDTAPISLEGV